MTHLAPRRRYNVAAAILMASYVVILVGVDTFFRNHAGDSPHSVAAVAIAALPALPIVGVFAMMGRYLAEEHDEYIRMVHIRQVLIATGFALSAATIWGFLESFGQVPHVDSYWVAIAWFGGLGLGACINKLVERSAA